MRSTPAIGGKPGRPLRRLRSLCADRVDDAQLHRILLRRGRIEPRIAKRGEPRGSGPGEQRRVVERTLGWPHHNRRLRVRYEKRADIHEAFMTLGCAPIYAKRPESR